LTFELKCDILYTEREGNEMKNYYTREIEEFIPDYYEEIEKILAEAAKQEREEKNND
jgi:hypothetical protein